MLALDGKTLCHSFDTASGQAAIHLVSAWASQSNLVLGQIKVDDKSNEITAIPALLERLDIGGCIVTCDAMGCQKQIAQQIIQQGGDYVLALKDNHRRLRGEVHRLFDWAGAQGAKQLACDFHESRTCEHGRREIRCCWSTAELSWLDETDAPGLWPGLSSVALVECERQVTHKGQTKTSVETCCFLCSLPSKARKILWSVRRHWGIEDCVHWVLDVAFDEDACRERKDNAPVNLATLQHLALNLLRRETSDKSGVKARRLRAGWDSDYLLKIIAG